jgi:hypothetical protein
MRTTKIKVELKEGSLAKWRKKPVYYGIKKFQVVGIYHGIIEDVSKGKPVTANLDSIDPASLVDGNNGTSWEGNKDPSWFEIDLKQICALEDIQLFWVKGPKNVEISHKVGTGHEVQAPISAPFGKVSLDMEFATKFKACGIVYTAKGLLRTKLYMSLQEFPNVRKLVKNSIDRME